MNKYTAAFSNGTAERKFAKPLTHAVSITYFTKSAGEDSARAVKVQFCQSHEAALAVVAKFPKRYGIAHSEIVDVVDAGEIVKVAKVKPAKAKPAFVKGDLVAITLGEAVVIGKLAKLGTKYAYVTVNGALTDIKVDAANVRKVEPSAPIAGEMELAEAA